MKAINPQELLSAADYEAQRTEIRRRIIALKKRRRITVGDCITLVFENRETVLFQIQEMLRTERIFAPEKIKEECDVYNALLPENDELSATLYIEITDSNKIQELLDSFKGIDSPNIVAICLEGGEKIFATFEAGHSNEEKISAVHFLRFPITAHFRDQLAQGAQAVLTIHHPHFQAEASIVDAMREEWLQDLQWTG